MDNEKDGGPAFPRSSQGPSDSLDAAVGMSMRDWIAGMSLDGIINQWGANDKILVATLAYGIADAMLEARAK